MQGQYYSRTIKAPESKIVPYASKKNGTISLKTEASGILLDEESYSHEQNTARNAGSLYIISRKNASEDLQYFPGWTGFNTQIHKLSALKSWLQLILAKYDINGNYS